MTKLALTFLITIGLALGGGPGCKKESGDDDRAERREKRKQKRLKAKTKEAVDQLDRIYFSARNYYVAPRVTKDTGTPLDCQFPANQGMTPDVSGKRCCGGALDADKDDRCDVNTTQWVSDTWSAMDFHMNDQHYFGYAFESSGVLGNARFTASAYADLDCDGTLSTFQRFGYADTPVSSTECVMKEGRPELKVDNELE